MPNNKSSFLDIINKNKKMNLLKNTFDLTLSFILNKDSNKLKKIVFFTNISVWDSKITFVLNSRYLFNTFRVFNKNNITFF